MYKLSWVFALIMLPVRVRLVLVVFGIVVWRVVEKNFSGKITPGFWGKAD